MLMVEKVLKENADRPLKKAEIKRLLPVKIMHQTLNVILDYLDEKGMILQGRKGAMWTHNPSPKLQKAVVEAEIAMEKLRKQGYDV